MKIKKAHLGHTAGQYFGVATMNLVMGESFLTVSFSISLVVPMNFLCG